MRGQLVGVSVEFILLQWLCCVTVVLCWASVVIEPDKCRSCCLLGLVGLWFPSKTQTFACTSTAPYIPLINVSSKHGGREHVVTAGRLCNSGFCCLAPSKRRPPQHSPSPTYLLLHSNPISCCTGHTFTVQHTCSIYVQLSNNWYPVLLRCYMYFHKTMSAQMHCNATKCIIISEPDFGLLFSSFFWGSVNGSVDKGVFGFLKFWWQSHRKHLCWTLVFDNSLLFNVHDGWHWWLKWSKTEQLGPFSNVNQLVAGNIFHILIAVVGCLSPGWAEQILRKSNPNHQRTHHQLSLTRGNWIKSPRLFCWKNKNG